MNCHEIQRLTVSFVGYFALKSEPTRGRRSLDTKNVAEKYTYEKLFNSHAIIKSGCKNRHSREIAQYSKLGISLFGPSGTGANGSAFAAHRVEIRKTRLGAEKCSFLFIFSCAALFYREYDAQSLQSYALLIIFYTFVCNFCIVTII